MPLDGLTLSCAVQEIDTLFAGGKVEKITQPEKDMLLFYIHSGGKTRPLLLCGAPSLARAHVTDIRYRSPVDAPSFLMLCRKLFGSARFERAEQLNGDRVLRFTFSCLNEMGDTVNREIYLEVMGHHSNLTLVQDGVILDAARHVTHEMSRVRQALPGVRFTLPPLQDKLDLFSCTEEELQSALSSLRSSAPDLMFAKALQQTVRGLSAQTAAELAFRVSGSTQTRLDGLDAAECAARLHHLFARLPALKEPQVLLSESGAVKDILPFPYFSLSPDLQRPCATLSEALDLCFSGVDREERIRQRTLSMRKTVKGLLEKAEKKLVLQQEEANAGAHSDQLRIFGEQLNAQLWLVPKGAESVTLPDLYSENGETITIPLDKTLTPAQNAQKYFKRYRKARAAAVMAKEQAEKTLQEIAILENAEEDLNKCESAEDLNDVRFVLSQAGLIRASVPKKSGRPGKDRRKEESKAGKPLSFTSPNGFTVLVGKNSRQNEQLTLSSHPQDLWLHAKDVPGSHVILRHEHPDGSREISDDDILFAARLAAQYSKGKGSGVQVDYTLRRYVRKPAGTPAGFVTYTNQKSLYL